MPSVHALSALIFKHHLVLQCFVCMNLQNPMLSSAFRELIFQKNTFCSAFIDHTIETVGFVLLQVLQEHATTHALAQQSSRIWQIHLTENRSKEECGKPTRRITDAARSSKRLPDNLQIQTLSLKIHPKNYSCRDEFERVHPKNYRYRKYNSKKRISASALFA